MPHTGPRQTISIGQFSRLSQLSVRMLRYYDEHQVLTPASIDAQTGYRGYTLSQVRDAGRVKTLRDLGFGVGAIAGLLAADPDTFTRALDAHRLTLEADAAQVAHRLRILDGLRTHYQEIPMTLDITRTTHPATMAVTLRRVIPTYADESILWEEMYTHLPPQAMPMITGPAMATFYDPEYRESDVDVEIAVPVSGPVDVPPPLACVEMSARDSVVATVNGSYDQVPQAMAALSAWMDSHDVSLDGLMYDRYLVSPAQNPDPDAWVTEVCLPVTDR